MTEPKTHTLDVPGAVLRTYLRPPFTEQTEILAPGQPCCQPERWLDRHSMAMASARLRRSL